MNFNNSDLNLALSKITDPTVVITFVDKEYVQLLAVFSFFWTKLKISNLLIICLDQISLDRVTKLGLLGVHIPYQIRNRHCFWRERFEIINIIFKKTKKHIVHTDIDCFWFKNIIPQLETDDGDIFYSRGNTYPKDIAETYGFVLCCGFFFVKYHTHTKEYFDDILTNSNSKDDQVMTNTYVLNNAESITKIVSVDRMFDEVIILKERTIKTIRQNIIPRWHGGIREASLFHPFLTGPINEKVDTITNQLLHYLNENSLYNEFKNLTVC